MIEPNIVKVPFRKLKHIHHISDIQIRNLKRHKEYEEVFERTYEEVRKNKDNAVAYIGGDIAHSKTDMSPELVDELSKLFKNLADIVPTIIIAGNHDCNLNNRSRLDVLTPIVNNLNHPNLHYLKDSGVYKCADTTFVVWDCWTDEKDFITADQVEGDTKVVLFHGTVDRCETDLGFRLPSDVKITKFDGYENNHAFGGKGKVIMNLSCQECEDVDCWEDPSKCKENRPMCPSCRDDYILEAIIMPEM